MYELFLLQTWHNFLFHEIAWRNPMSPSQPVQVTRQALTPQTLSTWHQPIQSTPWECCIHVRERLHLLLHHGWEQNSDGNGCLLCLVHPVARSSSVSSRCSSSEAVVPVASRPGARLPGFRFPDTGDGGVFTCSS